MRIPAESLMTSLTIIRYPEKYSFFALLAMVIHRLPLWLNKEIHFWKLLGCGQGGGFSKKPDWQQWVILVVRENPYLSHTQPNLKILYGRFIAAWFKYWKCETHTFLLEPLSGHGKWDEQEPFGPLEHKRDYSGKIAILTRATIRITKLTRFWAHVKNTSDLLHNAKGLIYTVSIGEIPFIKQATFSIWENVEAMLAYAYQTPHKDVVQKTRNEKWYSEELFVRLKVLQEFRE